MDGLPGRYEKSLRPMVFAKVSERFQIGSASEIRRSGLPKIGLSSGEPRFLLWGDSHTAAISEMVHEASESLGLTGYIASRNATPPLLQKGENGGSDQQEWNDAVFQVIQQQKIKNVIIVASWRDTLTVRLGKEPKISTRDLPTSFALLNRPAGRFRYQCMGDGTNSDTTNGHKQGIN